MPLKFASSKEFTKWQKRLDRIKAKSTGKATPAKGMKKAKRR